MSETTEVVSTEVVSTEQVAEVVSFQRYKIYVIDNTSRMHTIRIGNGVVLTIDNGVEQTITHENALSFYESFMELILGDKVFSFRNEEYAMIYKTKNLVGIQIIPEEY
jgi:hypothetical protein